MKRAGGFIIGLLTLAAVCAGGAAGFAALKRAGHDPCGSPRCPCGLCGDPACRCVFETPEGDHPPGKGLAR